MNDTQKASIIDRCQDDDCGTELVWTRSDAVYCSNACRQRAYRRRQQILRRYGSWENALAEIVANAPWAVTDAEPVICNGTGVTGSASSSRNGVGRG